MIKNKEPDLKFIEDQLKDWEWKWVNGQEVYTTKTKGDPVEKSKQIHRKYFSQISK